MKPHTLDNACWKSLVSVHIEVLRVKVFLQGFNVQERYAGGILVLTIAIAAYVWQPNLLGLQKRIHQPSTIPTCHVCLHSLVAAQMHRHIGIGSMNCRA